MQDIDAALPLFIASDALVSQHLKYKACIALMREAMIDLSLKNTSQLPRGILRIPDGNALGVMAGVSPTHNVFGVKVVSVYPENHRNGLPSHQGAVLLFDPGTGKLAALVDAHSITRIRTASASAAATDALARLDATNLAVLGYGEQAQAHIEAISLVRKLSNIKIWGRDFKRCEQFADKMGQLGHPCEVAADVTSAVGWADIICTNTAAQTPILLGQHVMPGTHVNLVGSSARGAAEADVDLICKSRLFADSSDNVLDQGEEFRQAIASGRVDDTHLLGEIGEIFNGTKLGRTDKTQITIYKSLGHIMQDLAAARYVYQQAHIPVEPELTN